MGLGIWTGLLTCLVIVILIENWKRKPILMPKNKPPTTKLNDIGKDLVKDMALKLNLEDKLLFFSYLFPSGNVVLKLDGKDVHIVGIETEDSNLIQERDSKTRSNYMG